MNWSNWISWSILSTKISSSVGLRFTIFPPSSRADLFSIIYYKFISFWSLWYSAVLSKISIARFLICENNSSDPNYCSINLKTLFFFYSHSTCLNKKFLFSESCIPFSTFFMCSSIGWATLDRFCTTFFALIVTWILRFILCLCSVNIDKYKGINSLFFFFYSAIAAWSFTGLWRVIFWFRSIVNW